MCPAIIPLFNSGFPSVTLTFTAALTTTKQTLFFLSDVRSGASLTAFDATRITVYLSRSIAPCWYSNCCCLSLNLVSLFGDLSLFSAAVFRSLFLSSIFSVFYWCCKDIFGHHHTVSTGIINNKKIQGLRLAIDFVIFMLLLGETSATTLFH